MPVPLPTVKTGKTLKEDSVLVTEAKILRIDILVEGKAVVFTVGYGYTDEKGQFITVEKKMVTVNNEAFIELSALRAEPEDVGLSMYELIGKKSYKFLSQKTLI